MSNVLLERFYVHCRRDDGGTAWANSGYVELAATSEADAVARAVADHAWPEGSQLGASRSSWHASVSRWVPAAAACPPPEEEK